MQLVILEPFPHIRFELMSNKIGYMCLMIIKSGACSIEARKLKPVIMMITNMDVSNCT